MANTSPSLFGASASATLALNDAGEIVVASTKGDDLMGAALNNLISPFNGGATVGVGLGGTIGEAAKLLGAMFVEKKLNVMDKILPAG